MGVDPAELPKLAPAANATAMPLFATLRFQCSETGKPIDYEVPGDASTLKDLWSRSLLRHCPHCAQVHRFSFRTAYVTGMLTIRSPQPAEE